VGREHADYRPILINCNCPRVSSDPISQVASVLESKKARVRFRHTDANGPVRRRTKSGRQRKPEDDLVSAGTNKSAHRRRQRYPDLDLIVFRHHTGQGVRVFVFRRSVLGIASKRALVRSCHNASSGGSAVPRVTPRAGCTLVGRPAPLYSPVKGATVFLIPVAPQEDLEPRVLGEEPRDEVERAEGGRRGPVQGRGERRLEKAAERQEGAVAPRVRGEKTMCRARKRRSAVVSLSLERVGPSMA
jgi:hypothetical protein